MSSRHQPDPEVREALQDDPLAFLYEDEEEEDSSGDNPGYGSLLGVSARRQGKTPVLVLDDAEAQKAAEVMEINAGQLMTNPERSHRNIGFLGLDPLEAAEEQEEEEYLAETLVWDETEDEDQPEEAAEAADPAAPAEAIEPEEIEPPQDPSLGEAIAAGTGEPPAAGAEGASEAEPETEPEAEPGEAGWSGSFAAEGDGQAGDAEAGIADAGFDPPEEAPPPEWGGLAEAAAPAEDAERAEENGPPGAADGPPIDWTEIPGAGMAEESAAPPDFGPPPAAEEPTPEEPVREEPAETAGPPAEDGPEEPAEAPEFVWPETPEPGEAEEIAGQDMPAEAGEPPAPDMPAFAGEEDSEEYDRTADYDWPSLAGELAREEEEAFREEALEEEPREREEARAQETFGEEAFGEEAADTLAPAEPAAPAETDIPEPAAEPAIEVAHHSLRARVLNARKPRPSRSQRIVAALKWLFVRLRRLVVWAGKQWARFASGQARN